LPRHYQDQQQPLLILPLLLKSPADYDSISLNDELELDVSDLNAKLMLIN
jgi:hypothetical protein